MERIEAVIIGAGQSGLSVGYFLQRAGRPFVILDAHPRVGDSWRTRWDSLRLFTPARFDGLAGMPFPAPRHTFPTKDAMADYLEAYTARFRLPVRTGMRVDRVTRRGDRLLVDAGGVQFDAANVVVAMATFQRLRVPAFARELDPGITQMHSRDYRGPSQLKPGGVLLVGAGNSGSEIGMEVVRHGHPTWLAGRDVGHVPFRIEGLTSRLLIWVIFRIVFHRILTVDTPLGRRARPHALSHGGTLIRVKPKDMDAAGIRRVPRMAGARDGKPLLDDGQVLDVANVIWCTGFDPGFSWLDLPVLGPDGTPRHRAGSVSGVPGLYFVGLLFLYAVSSTMIHGAERDAQRIADAIIEKARL